MIYSTINLGISIWTLKKFGLTYSWNAKNTILKPPYIIQWESISGLPNKGKVEFFTSSTLSSSSYKVFSIDPNNCLDFDDSGRKDCVNEKSKTNDIYQNVDDVEMKHSSDDYDSYDVSTDSRNDNSNDDDDDDDDDDNGVNSLYTYKALLDDINYQQFMVKNQLIEQQLNSNNDNTVDDNNENKDSIIIMKMTISYDLPDIGAFLLQGMGSIATDFIDKTLIKDLERFDEILKSKYEFI